MGFESIYPRVVGQIYDCVGDPTLWRGMLTEVCRDFGAVVATISVTDAKTGDARLAVPGGVPAVYRPLEEDCPADPGMSDFAFHLELDQPIGMAQVYAMMGPEGMKKMAESRVTQEWAIPNRIVDGMMATIYKQDQRVGLFNLNITPDRPPIGAEDLQALAALAPHLRRAITIGDLFDLELRNAGMFKSVVDGFGHAVIVVNDGMNLLYANPAAESLLRASHAAKMRLGQVVFSDVRAHNAIEHAVRMGNRDEVALNALGICVPVLPAGAVGVAHVLPLERRSSSSTKLGTRGTAAIFIAQQGSGPLPAMDAISALFGLTAAEKRVTRMLAEGQSQAEIAQIGEVSENTVRSQIKSVFSKTGVGTQRELMKLVMELTPNTQ